MTNAVLAMILSCQPIAAHEGVHSCRPTDQPQAQTNAPAASAIDASNDGADADDVDDDAPDRTHTAHRRRTHRHAVQAETRRKLR